MKKNYVCTIFVFLVLALTALPAFSQSQSTGNITGRAQDDSGALIPGVEVSITSPSMIGGARTAVTDETGTYRFTLLPTGTYRVSFGLAGFQTLNVDQVIVEPNKTITINGKLSVVSVANEITVVSQAPAIDLEAATVGVNWDIHKLDDIPYSRSLTSLNAMLPGVFFTGTYDVGNSQFGTGSAVSGKTYGRTGNNVMAIDGLVWCQGYADYGSFEEINFTTASKGADQGNSGVTMEMTVKSGGNQFHGSFNAQYENGNWKPFGQATNIDANLVGRGFSTGSNKFTNFRNIWGELGGPILKNKAWFYFIYTDGQSGQYVPGYIGFANSLSADPTGRTGVPSVFTSKLQDPTGKLTYQLTSKQKLEVSWPLNLKIQAFRNASNRIPLEATQNQHSWATYGPDFKWTDIINSRTTATFAVDRGGYWWPDIAHSGAAANSLDASTGVPTLADANDVRRFDTTTNATLGPQLAIYRRPIRWTWTGDVSRFQSIFGKNNELKAGYTGWWTKNYTTNLGYPNQQVYEYQSLTSEDYTVSTPLNILGVFQHPFAVQVFDYPNTTISAFGYKAGYVNDKITMTKKLTTTIGLRMDYYNSWLPPQGRKGAGPVSAIPNGVNSPPAPDFATPFNYQEIGTNKFPTYLRFDPRISFAYDLTGNGKVAIKGSYGRYTAYSSGIGSPLNSSSTVNPNATTTCTYKGWKGDIPFTPAVGNYSSVACTGGGGSGAPGFSASDPTTWQNKLSTNLDSDYLDEYTAGADIGFSRNYSLRINVVRKFDYPRTKSIDQAQPFGAWSDQLCYNYNAAANTVVAAPAGSVIGGDANSGTACVFSVPKSYPTQGQINTLVVNNRNGEAKNQFTAYEVTFNKQASNKWSALGSYVISMGHTNPFDAQNPNDLYYHANGTTFYGPSVWDQAIKLNGTYDLPWGFRWATNYTAQSGNWIPQQLQVKNNLGVNVVLTLATEQQRYPWVNIWDQRFSKIFKLSDKQSIEGDFEVFNTVNANTVTGVGSTIGTAAFKGLDGSLYRPNAILSPRIFQFTAKYKF